MRERNTSRRARRWRGDILVALKRLLHATLRVTRNQRFVNWRSTVSRRARLILVDHPRINPIRPYSRLLDPHGPLSARSTIIPSQWLARTHVRMHTHDTRAPLSLPSRASINRRRYTVVSKRTFADKTSKLYFTQKHVKRTRWTEVCKYPRRTFSSNNIA